MAKKKEAEKENIEKIEQESKPEIQELTFTEAEHKSLVDYMNFVNDHSQFSGLNTKKIHEFAGININAIRVIKKIEAHIFELKRKLPSSKAK